MKRKALFFIILIFILSACSPPGANDKKTHVTVSAAASMMDSLTEIKDLFQQKYPEIEVMFNFGGSGALRKQIEQGGSVDLFFSASERDYELLAEAGFIKEGTVILQNRLVVIQPKDEKYQSWEEFIDSDGILAIGTPEAVPAGTYAKEALQSLNIWEKLQTEKRLVYTKDVQQALTYVRENSVDAGIVYFSDAADDKQVHMLEELEPNSYSSIHYYAAVMKQEHSDSDKREAAELFYDFVQQEESMEVFENHGFGVDIELESEGE